MPCVFNIDRSEIDGEYVESSVRCTLQDAAEPSYETIGSVCCHGFEHQTACPAAGEGFSLALLEQPLPNQD